jgi:hypothetical protein
LQEIRALEPDLLQMAAEVPAASDDDRQRRLGYLGEFFEEAADQERLLQRFEKRCL